MCRGMQKRRWPLQREEVPALPLSRPQEIPEMMGAKGLWFNLQCRKSGTTTLKFLDEVTSGWADFSLFRDCRPRK